MSSTAVLLCSRASVDAEAPGDATVVEDLCDRPAAAVAAFRESGADRVVLGLCRRPPSAGLLGALNRAGAAPFGIEAVVLDERVRDRARLLIAAARAKLDALPAADRGRPALNGSAVSRRALFSLGGAVTRARIAELDESACVGTARCGICVARCPANAIAATSPTPAIDPGACTACGRCVPRCPQSALHLSGAATAQTEAQLDKLASEMDGIVFACAAVGGVETPRGWALVELPTLALVTTGWILQLYARGVPVRLEPCDGPCCVDAPAVRACANSVLELAATPDASLLDGIRLSEPAATAEAVHALVPAGSTAVIADAAAPLGVLNLDTDRCTLCGACANACPTGALRFDEATSETALRFTAAACVACKRCVAVCPEEALAVSPGIDAARLVRGTLELAQAAVERCRSCGAELPPGPMRRRLRELVPRYADAPVDLCAGCAARTTARQSNTIA